ncbi:MAG TPA: IS701 family transposase [Candidatus Sulfotelmatobacter sp.]|nr:IS701 family transposase [Candidatus Sulfotelmatobacter sp.]
MPERLRSGSHLRLVPDNAAPLDTSPIQGAVHAVPPITVEVASHSPLEPLWDRLVRAYHYLGYQKLLGHRLKYLALLAGRPVAALAFSAPARVLRVRDQWIGWSAAQRQAHLDRVVNNSRFLIPPWVAVKNLASHVLAHALAHLPQDWAVRFGTRPWLVETFVDPARFHGTCYRAANWQRLGLTFGSGKQGKGYVYHGVVKEVYVYVLAPRFRTRIGCQQQAVSPSHRPPPSLQKVEDLQMILRHADWHPELVPRVTLTEADCAAIADELVAFHAQFQACLGRIEHRRLGLAYLSGLLSNNEAKSVEPIALRFLDADAVRPLQRFLKSYRWDDAAMAATHQALLAETLAAPDGMLTVDSCEFPKKGTESVGVARQYCGACGKVDNCQSGVFIGYTSDKGYGLLDSRLYLPASWLTPEQAHRRQETRVPPELPFQTKPQIAQDLLARITQTHRFPATWIGCDAVFGADWAFLDGVPPGTCYFASVRATTLVFRTRPRVHVPRYRGRGRRPTKPRVTQGRAVPVRTLATSTTCPWTPIVLAEGAKGPIRAEVAAFRIYPSRDGLPLAEPVWLFLRRTADGQLKYAFSNAPADTPLTALCRAATLRWPIEQCFQDGKSQVGMDHYEHRSWPAWHRHMLYVCLALHFLLRLRLQFKQNAGPDAAASPSPGGGGAAGQELDAQVRAGARPILYEAESRRLSVAPEEAASAAS